MLVYRYYCLKHSPSPGIIPGGFVGRKVWGSRPYLSSVNATVYGTVDYEEPLSAAEMNRYGLFPTNYVAQPVAV